jgi:acetyl esterase/lipase
VSPLRANSLANLPSTLLIGAEIDPLVDEGLEYAGRLANEKVLNVVHQVFKRAPLPIPDP